MSDLISRQEAIDEVKKLFFSDERERDFIQYNHGIADSLATLEKLPPARQWIPVSNPPKESGCYLATVRRSGYDELVTRKWFDSELNLWSMVDFYVPTAWMPLPEPYKEGE